MNDASAKLVLVEDGECLQRRVAQIRRMLLDAYREHSRFYVTIRSELVPLDFFRRIVDEAPQGCRIMDVGSGIGYFTLLLASLRPDIEFLGLELNARRVAAANEVAKRISGGRVSFLEANLYESRFSESFDGVIALDLLHHLNRPASDRLVREIHGCLVPGGIFWVKEIDTHPRLKWLFNYIMDLLMARRDSFSYFSLEARQRQLRESGFASVTGQCLPSLLPYPHIMVRGRKPSA